MIFLNFLKQLHITAKFIVAAVLVIVSITLAYVLFAQLIIEKAVLENTKIETASLIQRMVLFHLSSDDFLREATPEVYEKFSRFSDAIRTPGIVRIKAWDRSARVLFSDDRSIVGQQFLDNPELKDSLTGKVEAEIQSPQKTENISEAEYRQLIEIYVPIYFEGLSEPAGVIETYYSLDAVHALIAKIWWALFVASCLSVVLLSFAFWKLFQHLIQKPLEKTRKFASDFIIDGEEESEGNGKMLVIESHDEIGEVNMAINNMLAKLRGFHRELEAKVRERTADLSQKIRELRLAKSSLQKTKEDLKKYYEAVEGSAEHIIITDADGRILYANKAAEFITGYTRQEMMGQRPSLWGGRMEKAFYEKMWKTIKIDKKTFHGEIQNKRKNGETYVADISISPILGNHGKVKSFVGIERDVTREREIDKMKSEFVSLASHQMQTPLTGIKWVVERLLKKEKNLSERGKEYLADIYTSGKRLSTLVNELLNTSRIEEGNIGTVIESIDVISFLGTLITEVTPVCVAKNISLTFQEHPETIPADTDVIALQNIVQSIVANAIEYTPRDGAITMTVEKKPATFVLSISDTGIGIPRKEQNKIFEKFSRAENAKKIKPTGSGLGLFIAKQAVELLGGRIWFESEEGRGSTFFVELPLAAKEKTGAKRLI